MKSIGYLIAGVAVAAALSPSLLHAQTAPKFAVDPTWPKDLPEGWITGQLGGVCTSAQDHVYVVNRRNITDEEKETSISAPSIIKFDPDGNVVGAWGDQTTVPGSIHGCFVDSAGNVWVAGNGDGAIQKYAPDGKLLMQIGTRGKFDSVDGTRRGKGLNAARDQFHMPAGMVWTPATATSTSPTATATGASPCSTRTASSCVSGGAKPRTRKPRPARPACSRRSCTASP